MLIIANIIVIISSLIMMIQHLAAIWTGRILRGVVSGIVTVTVPVFINEIAVRRYKTMQLGLINFFIVVVLGRFHFGRSNHSAELTPVFYSFCESCHAEVPIQ